MKLEELENNWNEKFKNTLINIQKLIKSNDFDDLESKKFTELARWIVEGDIPTYEYLNKNYYSIKENPFEMESFLNNLHHAMVDDGDCCFVTMRLNDEIKSVKLLFVYKYEDNVESVFQEENQDLIKSSIDGRNRVISFATKQNEKAGFEKLKVFPEIKKEDFNFETHNDPKLFVKQVENLMLQQKLMYEEFEEKKRTMFSKLGK